MRLSRSPILATHPCREGREGTGAPPSGLSTGSPGKGGWDGEEDFDDELDDEAGELLAWSKGLDFEVSGGYFSSWCALRRLAHFRALTRRGFPPL